MAKYPKNLAKPYGLVMGQMGGSAEAQDILTTVCLMFKMAEDRQRFASGQRCKDEQIDLSKLPNEYTISRQALAEIWGKELRQLPFKPRKITDKKSGKVGQYPSLLQTACESLMQEGLIRLPIEGDSTGESFQSEVFFTGGKFDKNGLTMTINEKAKNILFDVTKGFALLDLNIYFRLKSKYSKRLFEMLTKFKNTDPHFTIGKIENYLNVNRTEYKHCAHFVRAVMGTPIKEIITVSKQYGGNRSWGLIDEVNFPTGIEIQRSMKNRTFDNDKVIFHIGQYEREESYKPITKKEVKKLELAVDLSEVVAAWRKGIAPTQTQAMDILIEIGELTERDLLTMADFKKLRKAIPPID